MMFISQQLICTDSDSAKELKHCVSHITFVTLPYQHLTRPYLAESVLAITLGSAVSGVNSSGQVQCITAFKTQSAELESSETLLCVLVGGHLM